MSDRGRYTTWLVPAAAGFATFLVSQVVMLAASPGPLLTPDSPGWFLNSGHNVTRVMLATALGAALATPYADVVLRALAYLGGAFWAMSATLFLLGGSNLFPIVIAIGTVMLSVATVGGTVVGLVVRGFIQVAGRMARRLI